MRTIDIKNSRISWGVFVDDILYYVLDKATVCEDIMNKCKISGTVAMSAPTIKATTETVNEYIDVINSSNNQPKLTANERNVLKDKLIEVWTEYFNVQI